MTEIRGKKFWWVAGAGLFCLFLAVSPGRYFASDVSVRLSMTRQLWSAGSVFLPGDHSSEGLVYLPEQDVSTSMYGIGQSLFLIPFDYIGAKIGALFDTLPPEVESLPILFGYVPLIGTLLWIVLSLILRQYGASQSESLGYTLIFGFSTIVWFYTTQSPQEEALVALFLATAFLAGIFWRDTDDKRYAVAVGACCGAALLVRLNSVLGLLPIFGLLLDTLREANKGRWKRLAQGAAWAIVGALPFIGLLMLFAYWRFGSPFATGYDAARLQNMGVFWGPLNLSQAARLAFGPGKGLLLLSPAIAITFWGFSPWAKHDRFACWGTALAMVLSLLLSSKILNNPEGSESWGARYQVHLLCFWIVPFYFGWRVLRRQRRMYYAYGLVTAGVVIQFASMIAPTSLEYLQAPRESVQRVTLTSSPTFGQLPLRMHNLMMWVRGRTAATRTMEEESRKLFTYSESQYVPNFWGMVYSKRLANVWPLAISILLMITGGLALEAALKRTPI
ncbi:hypothetical protein K2X33_04055 [bacterium]|nr:hypothetical protein [bacterium]